MTRNMISIGRVRGDAYQAIKQQLLVAQRERYASLSFVQEQRRLRIHLRRILLVNGVGDEPLESKVGLQVRQPISQEKLRQWRDEAIARDIERHRRLRSVITIQTHVRRWLASRQDNELPSTSEFIRFSVAEVAPFHMVDSPRRFTEPARSPVGGWLPDSRPTSFETITEPFQVIAELLGVRDLVFPQGIQGDEYAEVYAGVQLIHQPGKTVLGRFETPPTPVTVASDGIQWDDQVLQRGIDPQTLAAESAIPECAVDVHVFVRRTEVEQTVSLGRLCVAMDLLETPLADKYAMTRWFPLERSSGGGRPARGEVRLSLRFLMRNSKAAPKGPSEDEDVWVPYTGSKVNVDEQSTSPPPAKRRGSTTLTRRRSTITSKKAAAAAGKPPLSPRREGEVPPSQAKTRVTSPVRYRKVEVISPPSSPSSYSSDSNALDGEDSPQKIQSPRDRSPPQRQSSGGIVTSAAARARRSSLRESMTTKTRNSARREDEGDASHQNETKDEGASPKKPFLKRKPYKVVFQKLDWSRVGAKTDSGTGAKGATSPTRTGVPSTLPVGNGGKATVAVAAPTPVIVRLVSVIDAVHSACKVTTQTAPLAQMKYKSERKKFLTSLPAKPVNPTTTTTTSTALAATSLLDETLQTLWTELHADADGSMYATRLANLLH